MKNVMEKISVAGIEIPQSDIAAEAQNHPAQKPDEAWAHAARALVVRQLLLHPLLRAS